MIRLALVVLMIAFAVLTGFTLFHHGYWGVIEHQFKTFASAQVFTDLVIALGLFLIWMWRDCAKHGRNPWPWIVLTCISGSFGPLAYLLIYKTGKSEVQVAMEGR